MNLYKTTIVVWSDEDPQGLEIDELCREAVSGSSYCSKHSTSIITNPGSDPDWDGTEFFGIDDDFDCEVCNNTGSIDTGNNDEPCQCRHGDNAKFNVTGRGVVSGRDLK